MTGRGILRRALGHRGGLRGKSLPLSPPRAMGWVALLPLLACGAAESQVPPDADALRVLWGEARPFPAFLEDVERARSVVAGAPEGGWRILAVAEDWCGDSAHTLPYVSALADSVDGLEIRVVGSKAGQAVLESHRTPDDRAATPTFLLLDDRFENRGCMVEKPPALQEWFLANPNSLERDDLYAEKYRRYESDGGRTTLEEIVAVLEAAAAGERRCQALEPAPRVP